MKAQGLTAIAARIITQIKALYFLSQFQLSAGRGPRKLLDFVSTQAALAERSAGGGSETAK
jgi:cell division protein FtsB